MSRYAIKEMFLTLQGEGVHAGRVAVFCRFAGCNLWSGRESDRAQARCTFCDTDFVGTDGENGGRFADPAAVVQALWNLWPGDGISGAGPFVVCTGGEPLLQLDPPLIAALKQSGWEIAVETNGTIPLPGGIDWVCVSPKGKNELVVRRGDELKLVYPQSDAPPERFTGLGFGHFLLQPMDGPRREENTRKALNYCLAHPQWRLSLQTHKLLGIP